MLMTSTTVEALVFSKAFDYYASQIETRETHPTNHLYQKYISNLKP